MCAHVEGLNNLCLPAEGLQKSVEERRSIKSHKAESSTRDGKRNLASDNRLASDSEKYFIADVSGEKSKEKR